MTVDSNDNVYCFSRVKEHPVVVFDRDGNFLYCLRVIQDITGRKAAEDEAGAKA